MNFNIISKKLIEPSIPTPATLRDYKLSLFDQLSGQIYRGTLMLFPKCSHMDNVEMCNRLENSLSETLHHFYPVAGVFVKNEFAINCNDRGVEVTRALVDGDIHDVIVKGKLDTSFLDTFIPPVPVSEAAILTVQLSLFSCGGLGLGFRSFHSICDGDSLRMFFSHWSSTSRLEVNQSVLVPNFNLSYLFPQRKLVGLKPGPTNSSGQEPKKLVMNTFLFTSSMISSLRQEAGRGSQKPPSRVLTVTAHIWRTLIRISKTKHGHSRPSSITFSMNLRPRLSTSLPPNAWGTFVSHPTARFVGDESNIGLNGLVNLLKDAIRKDIEDFSRDRSEDQVFTKLIGQYNETHGDCNPLIEDVFRLTSWSGLSIYEASNFGWGKPIWIGHAAIPIELVLLMDAQGGDELEAWLSLHEDDMVEFQRHFLEDQHKLTEPTK